MNEIIEKIVEANKAYRSGNPIMSDQEYDDLLDSLRGNMTAQAYEEFIATLNEGGIEKNADGKVKHPFIMGSLEKLKAEEPEVVKKWIRENIKVDMSVSAKVDGISSRAFYRNGKLISLTTRGDGYYGMDITSKAKYILKVSHKVPSSPVDTSYTVSGFSADVGAIMRAAEAALPDAGPDLSIGDCTGGEKGC